MGKVLFWFRRDLRLSDNPAFSEAAKLGALIPFFILEEGLGAASAWWLYKSLTSLNTSLNGKLLFFKGNPHLIIEKLFYNEQADALYFNRIYEPKALEEEKKIRHNFPIKTFNGSLLWKPSKILKNDGTPYKVFTHFYRKGCLNHPEKPRKPLDIPSFELANFVNQTSIEDLQLLPQKTWYRKFETLWDPGENSSQKRAKEFLISALPNYKKARDFPHIMGTSRLSPALHWGEISPNQLWYDAIEGRNQQEENLDYFLRELAWREFSYNLLYHNPDLPNKNFQPKFDKFAWFYDEKVLEAWKNGRTGYPLIDAGMRELWETGFMHNRVRMVVASFLVKNLLLDWKLGERVFWDRLLDADLANNVAGWQWVAGCGADAAPYFRIFNPTSQAEKFDPLAIYIRKYLPEIAHLSQKEIFTPWHFGYYIKPIVALDVTRKRALELWNKLKVA